MKFNVRFLTVKIQITSVPNYFSFKMKYKTWVFFGETT